MPPLQFVRGGAEKLAFEVLLDTTQEQKDVRAKYVAPLRKLMDIDQELHAPPVLKFAWGFLVKEERGSVVVYKTTAKLYSELPEK